MIRHFRTDRQAEFFAACARVVDCELCTVAEVSQALQKDARVLLRELKTNDVRAYEWKGVILISLHDWMVEYELKKQEWADRAAAAVMGAIETQDAREAAQAAAVAEAKARHTARTRELEEAARARLADQIPTALGSTEPTAEEMCHWTPEMKALAARDGVSVEAEGCGDEVTEPVGLVWE